MELQAEDRQRGMTDGGDRAGAGRSKRFEIAGDARDLIAVRHPNFEIARQIGEEFVRTAVGRRGHMDLGSTVLAGRRAFDLAAERFAGELHAVADAEDRDAEPKKFDVALRRAGFVDAARTAGEDDPFGRDLAESGGRDVVADDFAVDLLFADAAGDELRVLRTEVEDDDLFIDQATRRGSRGGGSGTGGHRRVSQAQEVALTKKARRSGKRRRAGREDYRTRKANRLAAGRVFAISRRNSGQAPRLNDGRGKTFDTRAASLR